MVSRGMFERHKLVFLTQMTIRMMQKNKLNIKEDYDIKKVLFLLQGGSGLDKSPAEWLDDKSWNSVCKLAEIPGFEKLTEDVSTTWSMKFKDWFNEISPEKEKIPGDYKQFEGRFEQILLLRAIRPDRLTSILPIWINMHLGPGFTDCDGTMLQQGIVESSFDDCD